MIVSRESNAPAENGLVFFTVDGFGLKVDNFFHELVASAGAYFNDVTVISLLEPGQIPLEIVEEVWKRHLENTRGVVFARHSPWAYAAFAGAVFADEEKFAKITFRVYVPERDERALEAHFSRNHPELPSHQSRELFGKILDEYDKVVPAGATAVTLPRAIGRVTWRSTWRIPVRFPKNLRSTVMELLEKFWEALGADLLAGEGVIPPYSGMRDLDQVGECSDSEPEREWSDSE